MARCQRPPWTGSRACPACARPASCAWARGSAQALRQIEVAQGAAVAVCVVAPVRRDLRPSGKAEDAVGLAWAQHLQDLDSARRQVDPYQGDLERLTADHQAGLA